MKNLKSLIFGLMSFVSVGVSGQQTPINYAKDDTVIKNNQTTITLYDSLGASLYKEVKWDGNVSNTYFTYDGNHNKTKQVSKSFDSAGNRTFTGYLFFEYNKEGNMIMKKQRSYGKNFSPDVFVDDKYKYKRGKLNREKMDKKYFSTKEEKRVKTRLVYFENGNFQRIGKIKTYNKGKFSSKERVIDLYNKEGKFLKEITL